MRGYGWWWWWYGMIYIVVAQAMRLAAIARDFIFV